MRNNEAPAKLRAALERSPVIAAVFDQEDVTAAITSPCEVVFLLAGSINGLADVTDRVHSAGKLLFVHIDLLEGIAVDRSGVLFLKERFSPDGIITTKGSVVRYAKEVGLPVIQRFFMLDSKSFESAEKAVRAADVDAIEILPGIMPQIIRQIGKSAKMPVIAGGLVRSKREAMDSLSAGAMAVSTSCKQVWEM